METSGVVRTPSTAPAQPEPSPVSFWETVNAYQRTAALRARIELRVFTAVGEGANTSESQAARCGASPRGIRILCDYLTVIGFLAKEHGKYRLTVDSAAFLDKRSPAYLGGMLGFIHQLRRADSCFRQTGRGGPPGYVADAGRRRGRARGSDMGGIRPKHASEGRGLGGVRGRRRRPGGPGARASAPTSPPVTACLGSR
jgi:hypothetical protein